MYPMSGSQLSEHCGHLCDSDPLCTSYSIARPPVLHADEYYYGSSANCCLEREEYPDGMFVDAPDDDQTGELSPCDMATACWTRFELNDALESSCEGHDHTRTKPKSHIDDRQCSLIWEAKQYTDESIQERLDFIAQGCQFNDATFLLMLGDAHDQCKAEIEEELEELLTSSRLEDNVSSQQYKLIAHGYVGAVTFGLLVPLAFFGTAILSVNVRLGVHLLAFVLTFATVVMAIVALSGMGDSSEGHLQEDHHISGLLLLLLMSMQTASGLLLPSDGTPVENSDEGDYQQRRVGAERLCRFIQKGLKMGIFCLGFYQVHSGLNLYAKRYDTKDFGGAYVGFAGISALLAVALKSWMKWKNKKTNDGYSVELQFRDINFD